MKQKIGQFYFLEGAADIIPFQNGQVLLGATHENEEGWDLSESQEAFESLTEGSNLTYQIQN